MDKYLHIIYILTITTKKETRTIISNDLIGIKQKQIIEIKNSRSHVQLLSTLTGHVEYFFIRYPRLIRFLADENSPKFDKEREKAALERVASSRRFASVAVVALGRKLSV